MDNRGETFVDDSPEDIRWLCNLSESELDMLIRLKSLILHRAKVLGHDELAKKFDLPTLRAVGLFLMGYLKGRVKDLSNVQGLSKLAAFPDWCNLLKGNPGDDSSIEELKASIVIDERKRPIKRPGEEASNQKKQRL
ncbi:GAMMA-TUBULIN COMPLEX COMPONENT [Salix viminalis]|uniref:GAMMA-TUBULIN COMPLEX COMPONENT n=2 Tax=Salix viminalis TaxID=40686 RepID=A0A6N2JX39_SALVM|nr:GAMMA-TUBULIN COMPLEX COMPONENT [Salix viminalis]